MGLSFFTAVLLARWLGVTAYGEYTYLFTWVSFLCLLSLAGVDRLIIRSVAAYQVQSAWDSLAGILRWANLAVWAVSLTFLGLTAAVWRFVAPALHEALLPVLTTAALLVIFSVGMRLNQSVLRGMHHVARSQIPETVVQPVLFLGCLAVTRSILGGHLSATQALLFYTLSVAAALFVSVWLLHCSLPQAVKTALPRYEHGPWLPSAGSLFLVNCLTAANDQVDVLMLGALKGPTAVSLYSAADRIAGLISFPLLAGSMVLAPVFAGLYASGECVRLQEITTQSARSMLLAATALTGVILFCGHWLLTLFGSGFVQGYFCLSILCAGQWINVAAGSVALLLTMTGHEREVARVFGLITVLNIALNALLIPRWSVEGAALSSTVTLILWNVALAWFVARRLGLRTTALG